MTRPQLASPGTSPRLGDILAPERNSFGVIRLAMAIAVLVSHSYWFTTGSKVADPLVPYTGHSIGEHAVQVFFFLSGILVAQSLIRSGSVLNYAVARALRIFPALIVCVLLTALVLGPLFTSESLEHYFGARELPLYVVKTLALVTGSAPLPHLFHSTPLPGVVNVSLWTLKYEVLCYLGLGLVGGFGLLQERFRPLTTVILITFVALVFIGAPKPLSTYTFLDNLRYFALYFYGGVIAFLLRDRIRISGWVLLPLGLVFAALVGSRFGELACCLFLGYATLWSATFSYGPLRAFTNANDYSYGVYIFAGPIQQLIVSLLPDHGATAVSIHALLIALPLAVFSWELVERPAIALRRPILAALTAAPAMRSRSPGPRPDAGAPAPTPADLAPARLSLALAPARRADPGSARVIPLPSRRRATLVKHRR